jgi:hypothetical protein
MKPMSVAVLALASLSAAHAEDDWQKMLWAMDNGISRRAPVRPRA